jgi:hypothetical protein
MGERRRLSVGDRAADFVATGGSGAPTRFYAHAGGRPTAVVFDGGGGDPRLVDLAKEIAARSDLALCRVTPHESPGPEVDADVGVWADPDGTVAEAYGVPPGEVAVVTLDANLRVLGTVAGAGAGDRLATDVLALLDGAAHRGPAAEIVAQAPVLLLPRVLDAAYRERLIRVWEADGGVETGVERSCGSGHGEVLDDRYKRRRDRTVRDQELLRDLTAAVGRRVLPEVRKAFAFRANRFEGFKIACYDASTGGFFRPHRDNLTPTTAHRVFALTLNLNDAYAGGQLRFPEYGNQLYRPEAGAALVFSCAHLHEVMDVTEGRRFVLLSFLYGGPDR